MPCFDGDAEISGENGGEDAGAGVSDIGYWIATADSRLPDAKVLGALATGIVKNTTTTGTPSIATAADIPTPLTTKGDLFVFGTAATRLPVGGTNGHVLTVDSAEATGLKWAAAAASSVALGALVGTGTRVPFGDGAGAHTSSADLTWNNTLKRLYGEGGTNPYLELSTGIGARVGYGGTNYVEVTGTHVRLKGRHDWTVGTSVVGASTITLPTDGGIVDITGGVGINYITSANWVDGMVVHLRFGDALTITHNAASPPGGTVPILTSDGSNIITSAGMILSFAYKATGFKEIGRSGGVSAHGSLSGLTTGDAGHTQFALLAGRAGSQVLTGGTGSAENLDLYSTAHATKGKVRIGGSTGIVYDETSGWVGIGAAAGTGWGEKQILQLKVNQTGRTYIFSENDNFGGAGSLMCAANSGGQIRIVASGGGIGGSFLGRTLAGNLSQEISNGTFSLGTTSAHAVYLGTNNTERASIDSAGNVAIGTAALATSATDGFLYIPTCAGAPSGTPTAKTGLVPIIFDTTNNKLYVYDGSWLSTAALT